MRRLLLFAKRPIAGHVKTRLVPPLSDRQALDLYRAFLDDQAAFLASFGESCDLELCIDGDWPKALPRPDWFDDLRSVPQGPGDLGRRLLRAFQRAWSQGAEATVVLGVDAPTLPRSHVQEAFACLERGAEAVVAPAEDGGYVLLGLRRPLAELFRAVPWGSGDVLAVTRERARECGARLEELPAWYDVDEAAGLSRLRADLASAPGALRAPRTARHLLRLDSRGGRVV